MKLGTIMKVGPLFAALPDAEIQIKKVGEGSRGELFELYFFGVKMGTALKSNDKWEVVK